MPQCSATAKTTGERCKGRAVTGYRVCWKHGAGSPKRGRMGGRPVVHGRYSKFFPHWLKERYEDARRDPDLLALRDEIALVDARVMEVAQRLSTGESALAWASASQALGIIDEAVRGGDTGRLRVGLEQLRTAVTNSAVLADTEAWQGILDLVERRRRLVETERRRLEALQQHLTAEQALMLAAALADIIKNRVEDKRVRDSIAADFRALIDRPHSR